MFNMGLLKQESFICLDLETTGLDPQSDRIIEAAAAKFSLEEIFDAFESLIDPLCPIPKESIDIHHITEEMVRGKPKIEEILPQLISFIGNDVIVGHGIPLDVAFLIAACKQHGIPHHLNKNLQIDPLRLARLYGGSPTNSLEMLRTHFNIKPEGAHRAMSDVMITIEVFKQLSKPFKTAKEILDRLKKPILLKKMPLGKHKGRLFSEIPLEYLKWASHQDFDQDLMYSLKTELSKRKKGDRFQQAASPFSSL